MGLISDLAFLVDHMVSRFGEARDKGSKKFENGSNVEESWWFCSGCSGGGLVMEPILPAVALKKGESDSARESNSSSPPLDD